MTKPRRPSLTDILMTLPTLSDTDRSKVRAALSSFGVKTVEAKLSQRECEGIEEETFILFYETAASTLWEETGARLPKHPRYLPNKLQRDLVVGHKAVEDLLQRVVPKVRHVDRLKFYAVVVALVVDYLMQMDIRVSPRTVAQQMRNCGFIIADQFPGYLRAGLLSLLIEWGRPGTSTDEESL